MIVFLMKMYHPSIFSGVPNELGVYVLRRKVEPYFPKSRTHVIDRVSVVGYSTIIKKRLVQYFCEHTDTAMTANIRNTAMALRDQITHVDCYFEPEIMNSNVRARAFERVITEELEPMLRSPKHSDNIGNEASELANSTLFREEVLRVIGKPSLTIRLPNRDNMIADLISMGPDLYGVKKEIKRDTRRPQNFTIGAFDEGGLESLSKGEMKAIARKIGKRFILQKLHERYGVESMEEDFSNGGTVTLDGLQRLARAMSKRERVEPGDISTKKKCVSRMLEMRGREVSQDDSSRGGTITGYSLLRIWL